MDHKQKSKLTPFQEKTPFFQKSNAKTLKNSFLFQKKHASCRVFSVKCTHNVAYLSIKERHSTSKNAAKTVFSHTKTGKMTSFFPKKAQKSDLSGSRVVYPCCFLLRVCGLQQSHTLKSARGMMFSASKVYNNKE